MLLLPLLLLQAAAPPSDTARRFDACVALTKTDAAKAVATADQWRLGGGGLPARQCLGLAYVAQERFGPAVIAFEQAAHEAEIQRDGRAATLWVQAGNAALAADDAAKARDCLGRALAIPSLVDPLRGEALLDRGRAYVSLGDNASARTDIDAALKLVPGDPMAWLLSATLARRQSDAPRAEADIKQALRLAGDDAAVQYEAGNIARLAGREAEARGAWAKAAAGGDTPAAQAARAALAALSPEAPRP